MRCYQRTDVGIRHFLGMRLTERDQPLLPSLHSSIISLGGCVYYTFFNIWNP